HQHHTAQRLARAIAMDAVIAWRALLLALLGRAVPEMPGEWVFSPQECRLREKLQPLVAPETRGVKKLSLGIALILISRLGGALKRSSREPPGPQTLLRGLRRLHDMVWGHRLLSEESLATVAIENFVGHA